MGFGPGGAGASLARALGSVTPMPRDFASRMMRAALDGNPFVWVGLTSERHSSYANSL